MFRVVPRELFGVAELCSPALDDDDDDDDDEDKIGPPSRLDEDDEADDLDISELMNKSVGE